MASLEKGRVFQNGRSRFENISGQYRFGQGSFVESTFTPSYSFVREEWWTPDKIQTATRLMQALHTELAPYGVPRTAVFDRNQFRLRNDSKTIGGVDAVTHLHTGLMFLSKSTYDYFDHRLLTVAHEYAHTLSARVLRNGKLRRNGLAIFLGKRNEVKVMPTMSGMFLIRPIFKTATKSEGFPGFNALMEAVVDKTARRVVAKNFEWYKGFGTSSGSEGGEHGYYIRIVDTMCQQISARSPEYGSPEDVYKLFEAAEFGDGRLLPLVRAIEATYGRGSFSKLITAFEILPQRGTRRSNKESEYEPLYGVLRGRESLDEFIDKNRDRL